MPPTTLQDKVRNIFDGLLTLCGQTAWRLGLHPDTLTVIGFLFVIVAAGFIAAGSVQIGGIILLLSLPLDALDGATARAMGRKGKFGGLLDSSLDRYADGAIFGGILVYFSQQHDSLMVVVTLLALTGSFTTSYVRARAGEAGIIVKIGLLDRMVRVVLLLIALIVPGTLTIIVVTIAVLGNFTTMQRLWYAKTQMPE